MSFYTNCKLCQGPITEVNKRYELVKCQNCNLIFCKKIFTQAEISDTYDFLYNKSSQYNQHHEQLDQLKLGKQVRLGFAKTKVIQHILREKIHDVFEIGAGVGIIANHLARFKDIVYHGIELDSETASKARSLGFNIENASFDILADRPLSYEAVIGFEVLEHLQDLSSFLKNSQLSLKDKGFLAFSVPNYQKIENYTNPGDKIHQDVPPVHLNFFTDQNIKKILGHYGFAVHYIKTKRFPYLNLGNIATYRHLIKSLFGLYQGPTIVCIAQKM